MAICGDGGFMMNSQEMETAVRLKVNLVVLILNDGAYGMIRWKQRAMKFDDFGLEFGNPDFVMYANSYGAKGHRVESTKSFLPLINKCFKEGGVHLIDLPVDYSENAKELIEELKEKVCVI
jgi:acetolactate synthase-1/2/3 large subunit